MKKAVLMVMLMVMGVMVYGQDMEDGEIFMSLEQRAEPFMDTPANTTVISREEIENSNAANVLDLLSGKKGLFVRDLYGNGMAAEIDLRGFGEPSASNVLVMVDGNRVNNTDMTNVAWTSISLDEVERIEIVYGKGAVLYGDNASAGVINIITRRPEESKYGIKAKYGSYLSSNFTGNMEQKISGRYSVKINADNLTTSGFRENTAITDSDASVGITGDLSEKMSLNSVIRFHQDEYGLPGYVTGAQFDAGTLTVAQSGHENDMMRTPSDMAWQNNLKIQNSLGVMKVDLNYRSRMSETDMISWFSYDTRTANTLQLTARQLIDTLVKNNPNYLQFGIDMYNTDYRVESYTSAARTVKSGADLTIARRSMAAYVTDRLDFMNGLNISVGLRGETSGNNFNTVSMSSDVANSVTAYEVSLGYEKKRKFNVYLDMASSYKYPLTDDYYNSWADTLDSTLKPQVNNQLALNVKYLAREDFPVFLTLYNMDVLNEIITDPNPPWAKINYDRKQHQGIELESSIKVSGLVKLGAFYTYNYALFSDGVYTGKVVPLVPDRTAGIDFMLTPSETVAFHVTSKYAGERRQGGDFSNAQAKLDPYSVVDAALILKRPEYNLKIGVNNLTNVKYSPIAFYSSFSGLTGYYPAPLLNWFVSVDFKL